MLEIPVYYGTTIVYIFFICLLVQQHRATSPMPIKIKGAAVSVALTGPESRVQPHFFWVIFSRPKWLLLVVYVVFKEWISGVQQ